MMSDDIFIEDMVFPHIRVHALVLVLDFRRQGIALVVSVRNFSTNVILICTCLKRKYCEVCSIWYFQRIGL